MAPRTREEVGRFCSQIITHAEHCGSRAHEISLAFQQAGAERGKQYDEQLELCTDMMSMSHALIEAAKILRSM